VQTKFGVLKTSIIPCNKGRAEAREKLGAFTRGPRKKTAREEVKKGKIDPSRGSPKANERGKTTNIHY